MWRTSVRRPGPNLEAERYGVGASRSFDPWFQKLACRFARPGVARGWRASAAWQPRIRYPRGAGAISRALVSKNELLRRVWAGAAVEENVLQVHISAIRKALGPDRGLIATASGQGYRLLGDWTAAADDAETNRPAVAQTISRPSPGNLPVVTSELIGREAVTARVANLVSAHRVVTLVGPGGIGKTRIALEVARALVPHFADGVWLVELASIADPGLVATVVAMSLGLDLGVSDVSPASLARAIATRRVLIVIDNCEHVIDEVARVVETIVRVSPTPHLLATSRRHFVSMANTATGCLHWMFRLSMRQCRRVPRSMARSGCSLRACRRRLAALSGGGRIRTASSRSVAASMAFPWRSSLRRLARPHSGARRLVISTTASGCWPAAAAQRRRGIALCGRRWTGATTCSPARSAWCSGRLPSSRRLHHGCGTWRARCTGAR